MHKPFLLGLVTLIGGWVVYDVLCRLFGKYPTLLIAIGLPLATWVAWGLTQVYSSRAALYPRQRDARYHHGR